MVKSDDIVLYAGFDLMDLRHVDFGALANRGCSIFRDQPQPLREFCVAANSTSSHLANLFASLQTWPISWRV